MRGALVWLLCAFCLLGFAQAQKGTQCGRLRCPYRTGVCCPPTENGRQGCCPYGYECSRHEQAITCMPSKMNYNTKSLFNQVRTSLRNSTTVPGAIDKLHMLLRRIHTRLTYEDQLATAHYRSLQNFYRSRLQNITTLHQHQLETLSEIDRRLHNLTLTKEIVIRHLATLDARIRKHSDALGVNEDKISRGDSVRKKQNAYLQAKMNATKREIEATVHVIDMLGVPTTIGESLREALNQAYRKSSSTPILPVPKVSNVTVKIPDNATRPKPAGKKGSTKSKSKTSPASKMCPCDNATAVNATSVGNKTAVFSNFTTRTNLTSTINNASNSLFPTPSTQPPNSSAMVKPASKLKADATTLAKPPELPSESKAAFLEVSTKAYEDLDSLRILLRTVYENLHAYLRILMAQDVQRANAWASSRFFYSNISARHRFHINRLESTRMPNQKKLNATLKALAELPKTRRFVERKAKKLGSLGKRYGNTVQSLRESFEMQQHYRAIQLQTTEKLMQLVESHEGDATFKVKDVEDLMKQAEPVFGGKPVLGLKIMEDEEDDDHRREITDSRSLPKDPELDSHKIDEDRIGNDA